jgi:hypothetical protein
MAELIIAWFTPRINDRRGAASGYFGLSSYDGHVASCYYILGFPLSVKGHLANQSFFYFYGTVQRIFTGMFTLYPHLK